MNGFNIQITSLCYALDESSTGVGQEKSSEVKISFSQQTRFDYPLTGTKNKNKNVLLELDLSEDGLRKFISDFFFIL